MDIDIDFPKNTDVADLFDGWVRASVLKDGMITPHPCGVYPQPIPKDPLTGLAAIPYDKAEELGFNKLDFLHLSVYDIFETRKEIEVLVEIEPDWNLLLIPSVVEQLFQLSKHFDVVSQIKPTNIEELADTIALIRPGKRSLLPLYLSNRPVARRLLYAKDENGFAFKKSHSFSYALALILQLHTIS